MFRASHPAAEVSSQIQIDPLNSTRSSKKSRVSCFCDRERYLWSRERKSQKIAGLVLACVHLRFSPETIPHYVNWSPQNDLLISVPAVAEPGGATTIPAVYASGGRRSSCGGGGNGGLRRHNIHPFASPALSASFIRRFNA